MHGTTARRHCRAVWSRKRFFFLFVFLFAVVVYLVHAAIVWKLFLEFAHNTHTQRRISFDRQNAKLYAMRPIWHHHFVCVLHLLLCSLRQQTKHRSRTQYMHMWASPSNHRRIRCIFFHFYFFGSAITLSTDNICRWFMPYFYNIHQNCRRWLCGMCSMRGTWGGEANTEYNVYIAGWNCRAAAEYLIGEFSTKSMIVMWRASWLLKSIYSANIVVEALDFRGVSAEICNFLHISTNQAVPLTSHLDSSTQIAHHHIPPGRVCAFCSHAVLHLTFVVRASTTQFCSVCNCLFTYCYYYMWIISTSIIYTNTKRCYYDYNCVRPVWCCSITCTTYMNLTQRKTKKKPSYTHHTHRNEWYLW